MDKNLNNMSKVQTLLEEEGGKDPRRRIDVGRKSRELWGEGERNGSRESADGPFGAWYYRRWAILCAAIGQWGRVLVVGGGKFWGKCTKVLMSRLLLFQFPFFYFFFFLKKKSGLPRRKRDG